MLKRFGLFVFLFAAACAPVFAQISLNEPPPDYVSDGCTLFPDGNYRDCCVAHDKDYYKGGTCKERRESDNRLYQCVRKKKGWYNKFVAPVMWVGVRVLGTSILPTPFRWGFGRKKNGAVKKEKNEKPDGSDKKVITEPSVEKPSKSNQ